MRCPLRVEEIFHLASGAIRIETTAGMVDRKRWQTGDGRTGGLGRCDAEIGAHRGGGLCSHPRSGRKAELSGWNNGVQEEIAGHTLFAAESLPHFAMQAEPLRRPVFGKGPCLQRVIDVAQAVEGCVTRGFALPNDLHGWADFELAEVQNREA